MTAFPLVLGQYETNQFLFGVELVNLVIKWLKSLYVIIFYRYFSASFSAYIIGVPESANHDLVYYWERSAPLNVLELTIVGKELPFYLVRLRVVW